MEALRYLDFDLQIERTGDHYQAQVLQSPAGEASATFILPFSADRLENLLLKMAPIRSRVRGISTEERDAAREFGGGLFESAFAGEVLSCFRDSLSEATRQQNTGVRIRLRLQGVPELADLPWEFLFDKSRRLFFAQSTYTPIVRYIEMPERIRSLTAVLPLRILVMISRPQDPSYPLIDADAERTRLSEALAPLVNAGRVEVEWMENATVRQLQSKLRVNTYHVFHFIGHGGFDARAGEGVLVLEDELGRGALTPASRLSTLLHDHRSLRLTVLNSCEGARNSKTDPFAGFAATLVQRGIPAVVAMQFEITDQAAITFSSEFYTALAEGLPVDAAMAETRKAILGHVNDLEWGTPVLYMRAADGVLFDLTAAPPIQRRRGPIGLTVQRKGRTNAYELSLTNGGDEALEVALQAADDGGLGHYRLAREVRVAPGAPTTVNMTARPRRPRFLGERRTHSFRVTASGGDGLPPVSATSEFDDVPFKWVPITGGAVLALSSLAAGFVLLSGGEESSPPIDDEPQYGEGIYFSSDESGVEQIYAMEEDGTNIRQLTFGGQGARLPDGPRHDDRLVFVSGEEENSQMYLADEDGKNAYQVVPTDGAKLEPNLSPDGEHLVFEVKRGENFEIYRSEVTGAKAVNLTNNQWADIDPVWSPDGSKIAFASNRDAEGREGVMEIYVMAADGSDPVRLTNDLRFNAEPTWSPDGEAIAYQSNLAGSFDIWAMSSTGTGQTRITTDATSDEFDPAWSIDSNFIAFTSVREDNADIQLVDVNDLSVKSLANGPANEVKPSWGYIKLLGTNTLTPESD